MKNKEWDHTGIRIIRTRTGKTEKDDLHYVLIRDITEITESANFKNVANRVLYCDSKQYFSLDNSRFVSIPVENMIAIMQSTRAKHSDTIMEALESGQYELRTDQDRKNRKDAKDAAEETKKSPSKRRSKDQNGQRSLKKNKNATDHDIPSANKFLGCAKLICSQWENCPYGDKLQLMDLMRKMAKRSLSRENFFLNC